MEATKTKKSIFSTIKRGFQVFLSPNEEEPKLEDLASLEQLAVLERAQKEADSIMDKLYKSKKVTKRISEKEQERVVQKKVKARQISNEERER